MPQLIYNFLAVGIGGAIGSCVRYCVALCFSSTQSVLSYSTLTVNILGSLIIGFLYSATATIEMPPTIRLFIFVGLLGGFTTFSSYTLESIELFKYGNIGSALLYILLSNGAGILAAAAGAFIGNKLVN